jgi:small subunit ribosomal protein S6
MANPYEVVFIFDSVLEEAAINEKLDRFHSLVRVEGADAPAVDHWGKRTLAYPVGGKDTGYYVVTRFRAEPTALPEFERALKLDESLLRHLIVLNDGPQPVPASATKSDEEDDE